MSVAPHVGSKKRKKSDSKPYSQINKCLNEKRRREQENIHIEELAELVSASPSDMSSLSCKPDKCAILKETVNQIRTQKELNESELCNDLQQSEVSSSKPNIINNQVFGAILLEAIDGFIFVVDAEGKIEFVSDNILSFLNYTADEVNEKIIYHFIHPDDEAKFRSNLLLMMPLGNGRDWSSENSFISNKPTKHFNCRFLVKQEESEIKMENKSSPNPQYENLNITANFMPLDDGNTEPRNGLTCIARRVPFEEKRIGMNNVEQFTTRIDREGKVIDIDTSNLSQSSSQFLRKELKNSSMLDLCHPSDIATFKQHLKETFESGQATCVPYKFRIEEDKYAKIQTKSKVFSVEEYAVSTHSIIRDSESSVQDGLRNISSPSTASTSSGPESISDSSTSMNGSVVLSPMNINNSYGNYSSSLNTANNSEFGLSDLVLDIFPSSNWTLDPGSAQSKESDCTSVTSFVSSPQTAPLSNRSEISTIASPTNSAFVPNITSTNRGGSSVPSPAMQSRAPTPYGGSCFSPSASQSSSGRSPPPRALSAKSDSLNFSTTETPANNISQSVRPNQQLSNQKLRNLLTQNTDDSLLRQNMRPVTQEEVAALLGSRLLDNNNVSRSTINQNVSPPDNVILRDLLSQDDENSEDVPVEPIKKCIDSPVPNPLLNTGACKAGEKSSQQRQLGNNMLRKLLNNDDVEKNYRKTDIIHQLLVSNPGSKITLQNDKLKNESMTVPRSMEVPKQVSAESSRGISADVAFITENALKRKSNDRNSPSTAPKKPNNGTHLAGQNPMLASMLAQTPQTPPSVPTCVASAIMTRLPQERLPKNLEKKLVHTPITAISLSGTPTSTLTNTIAITSPSVQRDIVTSGGHVVQQSAQQIAIQSGLRHASFLQQQQHQGILDKILSTGNNEENIVIPRSLAISLSNMANPIQQNAASLAQLAPTVSDTIASTSFAQILNEATLVDVNSLSDAVPSNQIADLGFDALLDQIYSLREEHNVEIPRGSDDPQAILKLLGDTLDIPQTSTATRMANVPSAQEINEKIAISAIQKELEGTAAAIANRANQNAAVISTYSQAGRPLTNVSGTPVVHAQITQEQLLLLQQQQQQQQQLANSSLPPNYSLVTNRVRLPNSTQTNIINQNVLAQAQRRGVQVVRNVNIGSADLAMLRLQKNVKQRALLQQQKRLLDQQKQQQLSMQTQPLDVVTSPGSTNFTTENINDLMNNTVAPNVTLLRSSGIPEVPGSARFNLISANSLPSPNSQTSPTSAQLSPGQRVNQSSPFSPLAQQQQPFPSQTPPPTSYQAARLSPHPPPSYPQAATSHSSSPISSSASPLMVLSPQSTSTGSPQWSQRAATSPLQNLQLQNPMLNAQLSQQASIGAKGIHLTAQQKQLLRNLQASANAQNARNIVFTQQQQQQSDSNFNPVSPVMVLQTQASQQRIQRGRIPSGTQNQSNFSSNDPVLSPQSLPSPSFSQSLANTPTSAFVSISSPGIPVTYSLASGGQHFTFERQNIQVFTTSPSESLRSPACEQGTSDSLQAQLRIINTTQNQQLSNSLNQQILQSLTSSGSVTAARVVNVNSLSREALEELGLSVELLSAEAQPASQVLLSQALLSDSSSQENSSQSISPRVQPDEPKPDQKKSLLQQLLSEPT